MNDKKLSVLILIFFLVFSAFTLTALRQGPLRGFVRARSDITPSAEKSIILAWPLTVKLASSSQSKITVFVRNEKEVPIANKLVRLKTTLGTISPVEAETDKLGKVEFTLESTQPGLAEITAIIDNTTELKQKVNVKFE